jgi:hypothetical protein
MFVVVIVATCSIDFFLKKASVLIISVIFVGVFLFSVAVDSGISGASVSNAICVNGIV